MIQIYLIFWAGVAYGCTTGTTMVLPSEKEECPVTLFTGACLCTRPSWPTCSFYMVNPLGNFPKSISFQFPYACATVSTFYCYFKIFHVLTNNFKLVVYVGTICRLIWGLILCFIIRESLTTQDEPAFLPGAGFEFVFIQVAFKFDLSIELWVSLLGRFVAHIYKQKWNELNRIVKNMGNNLTLLKAFSKP